MAYPSTQATKSTIHANSDDTHDLQRLVDDLFAQLKGRITKGASGLAAFKVLSTELANYFDRAPRGVALETLQTFGVRSGTPFSSKLRA